MPVFTGMTTGSFAPTPRCVHPVTLSPRGPGCRDTILISHRRPSPSRRYRDGPLPLPYVIHTSSEVLNLQTLDRRPRESGDPARGTMDARFHGHDDKKFCANSEMCASGSLE